MPETPMAPVDALNGPDPTVHVHREAQWIDVARCDCGWTLAHVDAAMLDKAVEEHQYFGHPAYRNPAIGCQAAPPWDHERWCTRPVGHDGPHWTIDFNGGRYWPSDRAQTEARLGVDPVRLIDGSATPEEAANDA
jgi:hypothetical protein